MLSRLDDYPIHQVPKPINRPATTDRHAYDRYWFGAVHRQGEFYIGGAFGRYANLGVIDGGVSISVGDMQHSFHASGAAPDEPTDMVIGPLRLEILDPMRRLRLSVEDNSTGFSAELHWTARIGAIEDDHAVWDSNGATIVDMLRLIQFGTWSGHVTVDGNTTRLADNDVVGVRDRSWGIRPVGVQSPGRPTPPPAMAWLWAPIHFPDDCRSLGYFQNPGGHIWHGDGVRLPVVEPVVPVTSETDAGVYRMHPRGQTLEFEPGTRWIRKAALHVEPVNGDEPGHEPYTMELTSMRKFFMRGIGYSSPEWSHGHWKGELAFAREDWKLSDVNPADPYSQHTHHAVKATRNGVEGVGLLEQIIMGPHNQMGLDGFIDGYRG
jgi:hypothetical protein